MSQADRETLNNNPSRVALHFDGTSRDIKILSDQSDLEKIIRNIAKLSDMRILHQSSSNIEMDIQKLGCNAFEDEGGISVQALISTSHIAIHTWPQRGLFMFDLVSCKPFDVEKVESFLISALAVEDITFRHAVDTSHPARA